MRPLFSGEFAVAGVTEDQLAVNRSSAQGGGTDASVSGSDSVCNKGWQNATPTRLQVDKNFN